MNYQEVRAKRLASAWQLKMSGSFSMGQNSTHYSYNDQAASVAFGETSIFACNDSIPRKQLLRWATPQTSILVPAQAKHYIGSCTGKTLYWFPDQKSPLFRPTGNSALVLLTGKAGLLTICRLASYAVLCSSQARFCKVTLHDDIVFRTCIPFLGALRFD